ncbi:FkbM family methyltransferase [Neisseriaceae bacterium TC5R-5]|nr:FkbM family methyltransferase [Neisseriaceae bacterium TC5R-5]
MMTQLPPAEVVTTKDGIRYLVFSHGDLISARIREQGEFDGDLVRFSHKLLNNREPGVIVDVGCNLGAFTIPLALAHPAHQFECFEVQRIVLNHFCGAVALNGLTNVRSHLMGLSDRKEWLQIPMPNYATADNIGAYSLGGPSTSRYDMKFEEVAQTERILMNTLDNCFYESVRLLKIDVEGLELKVLEGGMSMLASNRYPPVIFQAWTGDWYAEPRQSLFDWLNSMGYEISQWGENYIAQHAFYGIVPLF